MSEYITLSDVVREVSKVAEEKGEAISNLNKVRDKYIQIFDMMNIDREMLKNGNDYNIPKRSLDFLVELNWFYTDSDVKKMRKGQFEQSSLESIAKLLSGFSEMIGELSLPDFEKESMISKMYLRTKYPFLQVREQIKHELDEIVLDFYPDYKEDKKIEEKLEKMSSESCPDMRAQMEVLQKKRFRYFDVFDGLDVNDELLFASIILEDIRCMIKRHRELYSYFSEIRRCELDDHAESEAYSMTAEEEQNSLQEMNCSIILQQELDKNEEYIALLSERKEILHSNDFINKVQPRFSAICERLEEITRETQIQLWGCIVVEDDNAENVDYSFRDSSENVLIEALKTYRDNNKDRRDYAKRMEMITDEERERVNEFIEKILNERNNK